MEHSHQPLVSIGLMTSQNRGHYLRGTVDSWLNQEFRDFELIISDDATTDDTRKICEEYVRSDPRVKYFRQEQPLEAPACYKFVLQQAKGTYFIWASDDDVWDHRFLKECVELHNEDPKLIMVFAGMVDVDRSRAVVKELDPARYFPFARGTYARLKSYIRYYFEDGKNQLLYGLWKRDVIMDDPLFGYRERDDQPPFYWGFSNYFVFHNLAKGPIGFVNHLRFFRRSRVPEDQRTPRPFPSRLALTIAHRFEKIFGTPYFWFVMRRITSIPGLSPFDKIRLLVWNFVAMIRLFFVRKI